MKEKYFKDYDEFWDYLLDHNCIKNSKNFCRFSLEKISRNKICKGSEIPTSFSPGTLFMPVIDLAVNF